MFLSQSMFLRVAPSQHCCVFLSVLLCIPQTESVVVYSSHSQMLLCIPLMARVLLRFTEEVAQQPQQLEMVTEEERRKQEEKSRKIKNIIGKSHRHVVAFVCALGVGQRTVYKKYML